MNICVEKTPLVWCDRYMQVGTECSVSATYSIVPTHEAETLIKIHNATRNMCDLLDNSRRGPWKHAADYSILYLVNI